MIDPIPNDSGLEPIVSILVITYNHGPYIEQCLKGLLDQNCSFHYEILVGEDCSTDDTRDKLLKVAAEHPHRIRSLLSKHNIGAANNLKNLLLESKGKYIALCEGDDYWHQPDKLARQIGIMESDPTVSLVCTDADAYFQSSGRRIRSIHERNGQWRLEHPDQTLSLLTRRLNIFTCTTCMARKNFLQILVGNPSRFSSEAPMSDIQLWLELSRLGKIVPIRESCATYRVSAGSASRAASLEKTFEFHTRALQVMEGYVREFGYDDSILKQVQMGQIWPLLDLVIRTQDENLRIKLTGMISERGLAGSRFAEQLAIRSVKDTIRMRRMASFYPLLKATVIIPRLIKSRIRRMLGR